MALTRKVDVEEVFRHPEIFSSNADAVDLQNIRPLIPLQIDPPDHKKYRKLLDPIFAPREVAKLEESLTAAVNELIDRFIDRGEVDFSAEFSTLFPTRVFLDLLGLPVEELPRFLALKDGIIRPHVAIGSVSAAPRASPTRSRRPTPSTPTSTRSSTSGRPSAQDDLLSRFLDASVDGERLTREDILDICFLFLIAGLDTVTASLDCMFAYLAQHPEQRRQMVDDPSLIPAAIEELLRWETPVMGVVRVAVEDTEIPAARSTKGDMVMVMLSSVNTDEADLPDADVVRFDREANRHLAFGGGVHRCLGSHLARLELRVALREWHRRIPEYEVAEGHTLAYTSGIRSIDHFPMTFTAATAPEHPGPRRPSRTPTTADPTSPHGSTMELSQHSAVVTGGAGGLGSATVRRLSGLGPAGGGLRPGPRGRAGAGRPSSARAPPWVVTSTTTPTSSPPSTRRWPWRRSASWSTWPAAAWAGGRCPGTTPRCPWRPSGAPWSSTPSGTFNVTRLAAARMAGNEPDGRASAASWSTRPPSPATRARPARWPTPRPRPPSSGMSLPLARDLAPVGIRVCAIAPGTMGTPLMQSAPEEMKAKLVENIVFPRRMGEPEEFARLVESIVTNPYLNGENIRLDGALRFPPK